MALKLMAGWDLYPGAADSANMPLSGAGVTGTHYAALLSVERHVNVNNFLGVSGRPEHKFGLGTPMERNGLLVRRSTSMNAGSFLRALNAVPVAPVNGVFSMACSFKFMPDMVFNGQLLAIMYVLTGGNAVVGNSSHVAIAGTATTAQLWFMSNPISTSVTPYLVPNREYHLEFQVYRMPGAAADLYSFRLFLDGDMVADRPNAITLATITSSGLRACYGHPILNANVTWGCLYADLIVANSEAGLFADRIGPHLVLPGMVSAVTPGPWEKEGNASAAVTLGDLDDATFFSSPATAGALTAKISGPNVDYKARASEVVVRASRDRDAGRILTAEVIGTDGSALIPITNIATGNGYADYLLQRITDKSDADTRSPTVRLNASVP